MVGAPVVGVGEHLAVVARVVPLGVVGRRVPRLVRVERIEPQEERSLIATLPMLLEPGDPAADSARRVVVLFTLPVGAVLHVLTQRVPTAAHLLGRPAQVLDLDARIVEDAVALLAAMPL